MNFFSNAIASFGETLPIMLLGMASIFAVIGIVAAITIVLNKTFKN